MPGDASAAQEPAALSERARLAWSPEMWMPSGACSTPAPAARGAVGRWQVLAVRGGRITDIRGFDDRKAAAARAGVPA